MKNNYLAYNININHKIKTSSKAPYISLILFLFVILFISESQALSNNGVIIPFIQYSPEYFLLAILLISCLSTLIFRKGVVDVISLFLFLRVVLNLIPLLYIDAHPTYFGNIIVSFFPLLIYFVFSNFNIEVKTITNIFLLFTIIVSIQCWLAYFTILNNSYASYSDPFYKAYFVIPIGATNNISSALLPLLIIGDNTISRKKGRIAYFLLVSSAIVLTKSRTGMILTIAYVILKLLFISTRGNNKTHTIKIFISIMAITFLLIYMITNPNIIAFVKSILIGFSSEGSGINSLFSGRLDLFNDVISYSIKYPIFGNGVTYEQLSYMRPHNIFLQMFYENGIFGLLGFIAFCFAIIRLINLNKFKNDYYWSFSIAAIFIFVNSLVEDVLFSYPILLLGLTYIALMKNNLKGETSNV